MTAQPEVHLRAMDAFSPRELYALLKLRVDVFVVDQQCPYHELDGKDPDALHLVLLRDGALLAAARILKPDAARPSATIGRVVVAPAHQGEGLGDALMRHAIAACEARFAQTPIFLSAQCHVQAFYARFGFEPVSDVYEEDGIAHVDMMRQPPPRPS